MYRIRLIKPAGLRYNLLSEKSWKEGDHQMSDLVKRDVKNTVFIDLFSHDEYRLQLFQTIHPEITDVTADDLPVITIKPVITNHLYTLTLLLLYVKANY